MPNPLYINELRSKAQSDPYNSFARSLTPEQRNGLLRRIMAIKSQQVSGTIPGIAAGMANTAGDIFLGYRPRENKPESNVLNETIMKEYAKSLFKEPKRKTPVSMAKDMDISINEKLATGEELTPEEYNYMIRKGKEKTLERLPQEMLPEDARLKPFWKAVASPFSGAEKRAAEGGGFWGNIRKKKPGGQVMIDANGNKAIVYPDGSYEELP